jgi:hypothetical protein
MKVQLSNVRETNENHYFTGVKQILMNAGFSFTCAKVNGLFVFQISGKRIAMVTSHIDAKRIDFVECIAYIQVACQLIESGSFAVGLDNKPSAKILDSYIQILGWCENDSSGIYQSPDNFFDYLNGLI